MANTSARKSTITPVIISVTDDTENEYDNSNAAEAPIFVYHVRRVYVRKVCGRFRRAARPLSAEPLPNGVSYDAA